MDEVAKDVTNYSCFLWEFVVVFFLYLWFIS